MRATESEDPGPAREVDDERGYAELMDRLQAACRGFSLMLCDVRDEELRRALRTIESADAVGFVVDPTKYREPLWDGGLERQAKLVRAVVHFRAVLALLYPEDSDVLSPQKQKEPKCRPISPT